MIVHLFDNLENAKQAINQLNLHHGFPIMEGGTQFTDKDIYHYINNYFIIYHEDYTSILGEPIEIELPTQNSIE